MTFKFKNVKDPDHISTKGQLESPKYLYPDEKKEPPKKLRTLIPSKYVRNFKKKEPLDIDFTH